MRSNPDKSSGFSLAPRKIQPLAYACRAALLAAATISCQSAHRSQTVQEQVGRIEVMHPATYTIKRINNGGINTMFMIHIAVHTENQLHRAFDIFDPAIRQSEFRLSTGPQRIIQNRGNVGEAEVIIGPMTAEALQCIERAFAANAGSPRPQSPATQIDRSPDRY